MQAIEVFFPNWKGLVVHEISAANRGAGVRLARKCENYMPSRFFPDEELGSAADGVRRETLDALTFVDESIDPHITQNVMKHLFSPSTVCREIARSLKPCSAHIFTVPLVNRDKPSKLRARMREDGQIDHLQPPEYHGSPISDHGALVTVDWGFDICSHIFDSCGFFTHLLYMDDLSKDIRAEYNEVDDNQTRFGKPRRCIYSMTVWLTSCPSGPPSPTREAMQEMQKRLINGKTLSPTPWKERR
jgi:SAM-dependent methyltransferase